MKEINVHEFSNGLNDTFRRYLATTNLIADTEPGLREEIWNQLGEHDFFARRPLVTSIPAYKPALAGQTLLNASTFPSLSILLKKLNSNEFDLRRPLYQHQIDALEKAQNGRNIIVATGTGSGKTECFLLPVLDDAAQNAEIGVRTIIVYPMNALANDQIERLRRLLKDLPEITFGRYTGETPKTRDGLTEEDSKKIPINERYSRQEIKDQPPHILLTNFAMLEYLLLRPSDSNIFRHQALRYVVLDEAHTYNGAQGIDISLLMRRLSQRYEKNDLQFILTSATLSEDESDDSRIKIAQFGKCLTGAEFEFNDVIFGEAVHGFDDGLKTVSREQIFAAVPTEESLQKWLDALEDPETLKSLINRADLPNKEKVIALNEPDKILYELFKDWMPVRQAYDLVSENAFSFDELTKKLWERDDLTATLALKWLLTLAARAKNGTNQPPLISARFHFFFRGLTGASVCLNPECDCATISGSTVKRIYLESRNQCQLPCESMLLPLSTCFQCGLPAVEVWLDENNRKWKSLKPSNSRDQIPTRLFLTWDQSVSETDETDETESEHNVDFVELCLKCSGIGLDGKLDACCSAPAKISLKRIPAGKDNNIKTCPRCGSDARPFPSVLREFRSGDDAVTAVLAEQIMRHLPEEENSEALPAGGRKMLAFSDSRQRAAFFAPYLKRTTAETEYSQPLYDSLLVQESKNDDEPVTINEIAKRFVKTATERKQIVLREYNEDQENDTYRFITTRNMQKSDEKNLRRQAEITLLKHFCASPRQRTTWSGLGLASAEIELTRGDKEDLQEALPEIFREDEQAGWDFIQQLLQIFLMRRALFIEDDEISNKDLGKGAREVTFHFNLNDSVSGRQRIRWNPYRAAKIQKRTIPNSYQANVVARFFGLDVEQDSKKIDEWLERIWNAFRETVFTQYQLSGGEYQIDAGKIIITTKKDYAFCDSCGRLTPHYAKGYCVMPKCEGRLKKINSTELEEKLARYHYRHRVLNNKPMALNVVEHTAQLTNRHGQDYQQKFIKGEINVLSSSTTFEMGVDVGGLKAVLLRNVPPTASNYIQRAGRAGRRRDGAAYAITYTRALPHDQYHFHHPSSVIRGKVPIPLINLKNTRLAKRHINSFLLGEFLRYLPIDSSIKNVSDFFLSPSEAESPFEKFKKFIELNQDKLESTIKFILPKENSLEARECIQDSVQKLKEVYSEKVKDFLDSFKKQHDEISSQKASADTSQLGKIKYALESIERLRSQLENEPLINFLSSAHWLPSYAFPQDTIRLFVRQTQWTEKMRLERDREQGISEYAPGAEIIADGKLFKSGGIMRPHRGFDIRKYRFCRQCRRLKTVNSTETIAPTCDCGTFCQINDYIVPTGFQTLYNEKVEEPNLFRLTPPSNTEISLINGTAEKDFRSHDKIAGINYGYRRDGRLFRANAGYNFNKFRLCRECGRHFSKTTKVDNKGHETPWGTRCFGTLFNTHLAHEFETDILQLRFDLVGKVTPPVNDSEFWLSLTSAFISAAAEVLTIPRNDLDAIYQSQNINESQGELIIYDKVPGGAGYVERIINNIPVILQRVLERTNNCENPICDENSSCYTCLRNYQNQFYWDKLKRSKITDWLNGY